jgi:CRISPR-associated Csx2 family protein
MSKKFISFLGTNDYLECIYYIDGEDKKSQPLKYVQEYSVKKFCANWDKNDKVLIFTTKTAFEKNWVDNGHNKPSQGLGKRLELLNLTPETKNIMIPDGNSEDEIWEIFEKVFDELENGDEIIFDITHAFRSIPMLAIVILNYAKVLKNVSLSGIYYGAMEALGSFPVVKEIELEKRFVPIFELTAFDNLLDWSSAIERFTKSGDASKITELAASTLSPLLKQAKGSDKNLTTFASLSKNLNNFSKNIRTNRKANGSIAQSAVKIKTSLSLLENENIIPAFKPLLKHIEKSVSGFGDDRIKNGLTAVKWCISHGLVQQGYTMLLELTFTKMILIASKDPSDLTNRTLASNAFHYIREKKTDKKYWKKLSLENEEFTQTIIDYGLEFDLDKQFRKHSNLINQNRNDLNHGNDIKNADSLIKELNDIYNYFERIFLNSDE